MGTYLRNHSDYEFSCADDKPQVEFMDFQNDGVPTHCDPSFGHVLITVPFPFNGSKPNFVLVGGTYSDSITIQNTSSESEFLFAIRIYASSPENSFFLSINRPPADDANEKAKKAFVSSVSLEDITLIRGNPLTIWLTCMPKDIGLHTSIVHFSFGDVLTICVALLLADDNVSKALSSDKPYYSRCPQLTNFEYAPIVPCIHEHGVIKQRFSVPFGDLSMTNYLQTFMSLLRMEQDNLKELIKSYDMHDVSIKTGTKHHCFIQLPGLAERRPSLIRGDNIIAAYVGRHSQTYKGTIKFVRANEVIVKFCKKFYSDYNPSCRYNVSFSYNNTVECRLAACISRAQLLETDILFPCQSRLRTVEKMDFVPLIQDLNTEQTKAVATILGCRGVPPCVIYGAPGTGNTLTVVEAILQVAKRRTNILVCAASNAAADILLKKLVQHNTFRPCHVFRLNSPCRQYEDVDHDLIQYCFVANREFKCPLFHILSQYKIVISTYTSSYLLQDKGIPQGHFTHIFLDDAGQVSEPETMIPLSGLCARDTVVVLAGDPMQLGPVVYCKEAEKGGLGKSYLQRLLDSKPYKTGKSG